MKKKIMAIIGLYFISMIIQGFAISCLPEINEDVFTMMLLSSVIPIDVAMIMIIRILPNKYRIIKWILKCYITLSIIFFILSSILTIFTDIQLCHGFYEKYGAYRKPLVLDCAAVFSAVSG